MAAFLRFFVALSLVLLPLQWSGSSMVPVASEAQAGKKILLGAYLASKAIQGASKACAKNARCREKVAEKAIDLGKRVASRTEDRIASAVAKAKPELKIGSGNGPTAGKAFGKGAKDKVRQENPSETCVFCERPGTGKQVDHAHPKSKGGDATPDNGQLACPHCNASKGNGIIPKTPPKGYVGPWPPQRLVDYENAVKLARGIK
jgi:5-methylcytosine-specific restriction endonuclease McrA